MVAIGMLVDGSVVMVENIFNHLAHTNKNTDIARVNNRKSSLLDVDQAYVERNNSDLLIKKRRVKKLHGQYFFCCFNYCCGFHAVIQF